MRQLVNNRSTLITCNHQHRSARADLLQAFQNRKAAWILYGQVQHQQIRPTLDRDLKTLPAGNDGCHSVVVFQAAAIRTAHVF